MGLGLIWVRDVGGAAQGAGSTLCPPPSDTLGVPRVPEVGAQDVGSRGSRCRAPRSPRGQEAPRRAPCAREPLGRE